VDSAAAAPGYAAPPQYAAYPQYPYPPYVAPPRVRTHLPILGVLWIVYIVLHTFGCLIGLMWMRVMMRVVPQVILHQPGVDAQAAVMAQQIIPHMFAVMLPISMAICALCLAFYGVVCYGLMARKTWGRILAIIAAIFALLNLPFGTAIGIYTLWVLAPEASKHEYDALVRQS